MRIRDYVMIALLLVVGRSAAGETGEAAATQWVGIVLSAEGTWSYQTAEGRSDAVARLTALPAGVAIRSQSPDGRLDIFMFDGRRLTLDAHETNFWRAPLALGEERGPAERLREAVSRIFLGNRARFIPTLARGTVDRDPCAWTFVLDAGQRILAPLADMAEHPDMPVVLSVRRVLVAEGAAPPRYGEPASLAWRPDEARTWIDAGLDPGLYIAAFPEDEPWNGRDAWVLLETGDRLDHARNAWRHIRDSLEGMGGIKAEDACGFLRAGLYMLATTTEH